MKWDIFISHASEDKAAVARPLAEILKRRGLRVWLDEAELHLGDSLRQKIDDGLSKSRFGVVVLSPAFFAKNWPQMELDALVAREEMGVKVVLPVWHTVSHVDVSRRSPLLAGRLAVSTDLGLPVVASQIWKAIRIDSEIGHDSHKSRVNSTHGDRELDTVAGAWQLLQSAWQLLLTFADHRYPLWLSDEAGDEVREMLESLGFTAAQIQVLRYSSKRAEAFQRAYDITQSRELCSAIDALRAYMTQHEVLIPSTLRNEMVDILESIAARELIVESAIHLPLLETVRQITRKQLHELAEARLPHLLSKIRHYYEPQ